jgi:hypothetical protein
MEEKLTRFEPPTKLFDRCTADVTAVVMPRLLSPLSSVADVSADESPDAVTVVTTDVAVVITIVSFERPIVANVAFVPPLSVGSVSTTGARVGRGVGGTGDSPGALESASALLVVAVVVPGVGAGVGAGVGFGEGAGVG